MSGKLKVSINESIEELEKLLQQASTATQKERLQMLYWLKRSLVNSRKQLASLLHRNEPFMNGCASISKGASLAY